MLSKSMLNIELILLGLMVLALISNRFQILPFKAAFGGFALFVLLSTLLGLVALVVSAFGFGQSRLFTVGVAVLAWLPLIVVVAMVGSGFSVPRIHDVSTDLQNNVAFTHAGSLRKPSENSVEIPSEKVQALQEGFYDLKPLHTSLAAPEAYQQALKTAERLGWGVTHKDARTFHFEAIDKTPLLGFVDDIAVRVTPVGQASKVDVRSVSRVGVSDLGANAKRIERFLLAFEGGA